MVVQVQDGVPVVGFTDDVPDALQFIQPIILMSMAIPLEPLEEAGEQFRRFGTVGPIFDPTGWMRSYSTVEDNARILGAFLTFRKKLDEIKGGIEEREAKRENK